MEAKKNADVCVVVANYNQAAFLPCFLQSIIDSSYHPKEVIIVDDASTDNSIEIIQKYESYRWLQIIQLKNNLGFISALNIGIQKAQCKYILRVDPDDFIDPKRIERQYAYLQTHLDVDIVGSNVMYVNKHKKVIFKSGVPLSSKAIERSILKGELPLFHGSIMGKATVFKENLFRSHIVKAQDYDFFCRIVNKGHILANSAEYLTYYRMHPNNTSNIDLLSTYRMYYNIRSEVFSIPIPGSLKIYLKYYHMYLYRKSLACSIKACSYILLFFSILLQPNKIVRRINYRYFG